MKILLFQIYYFNINIKSLPSRENEDFSVDIKIYI